VTGTNFAQYFPSDSVSDSFGTNNSLNSLHYSPLNFREYAPGGIATFTMRGTTPQQNEVFWNGLLLNNPMTGLSDMNLFPIDLFESVTLQPGHNKNLDFSGYAGGAIVLDSDPKSSSKDHYILEFENQFDQIRNQTHRLNFQKLRRKTSLNVTGLHRKAKNNFRYTNPSGVRTRARQNNLDQNHLLIEVLHRINRQNQLKIYGWYQNSARQIPPTLFQSRSGASLQDQAIRTGITYNRNLSIGNVAVNAGFISEDLIYEDSLTSEFSDSRITQFQSSIKYQLQLRPNIPLKTHLSYKATSIQSTAYESEVSDHEVNMGLDINYESIFTDALTAGIKARKTFSSRSTTPLLFQFESMYQLNPSSWISGSIGGHFRLPTYNDLYWPSLGNPDLKPEKGWSAELGYTVEQTESKLDLLRFSVYWRETKQMIFWNNISGSWRPENLSSVRAKGIEIRAGRTYNFSTAKVSWNLGYDLNFTELTEERFAGDRAKGKQLPYQPKHNVFCSLTASWNLLQFSSRWRYTSTRYVAADHSSSIDPVLVGAISLDYRFNPGSFKWTIGAYADNILDAEFQSVNQRPMPGRVIGIKSIIKFTKP
jgi:vitamin B12 transporter